MSFDPFGDQASRGYLRNIAAASNPNDVKALEHVNFKAMVRPALEALETTRNLQYENVLQTNKTLFGALYPWAGQDRLALAPDLAIGKGGHFDLFAHPRDVQRAVEYSLNLARDPATMRDRPGEIFGLLAYAHPFLETNGRTLMTVHADMTRRAGFHIAWPDISKAEFLTALTTELRQPGSALDALIAPHIKLGKMAITETAAQLSTNAGLNPVGPTNRSTTQPGPSPGP